ncbi:hypothetical protein GFS03_04620 [Sulfolobus sp. E5-1-F]|uniref:hypothetical protein n=1 Tax=Saccharolobus sp. E5-1-F TaxID=2663019 RepID=UPI001297B1D2|nr:hypothetical protein [Sulfolobus sp. E5-1-F]QGA53908.1 hypothetical protein GFS03_04620 [Sulfolobus sp. E5-1-F]
MSKDVDAERKYIHLVVGITGHRDIPDEDRDRLKELIKGVFRELRSKFPDTPLLLLTPLAEGADRIAAEAALEEGVKYVVVLPMREDLYKDDFKDSLEEYERLKKQALGYFTLPIDPSKIDAIKQYGPERDQRYEEVGVYIVKHCQVLIALWDGKVTGLKGGTSEIVKFKLEGLPNEYTPYIGPLDEPDKGVVVHIRTRRKKYPELNFNPTVEWLCPEIGQGGKELCLDKNETFKKIDEFNREVKKLSEEEVKRSRDSLVFEEDSRKREEILRKENFVSFIFGESDAISIRYRDRWRLTQISQIFILGFLLLTLLLFYELSDAFWALLSYSVLYIVSLIIFRYLKLSKSFRLKYIQYRALAEGLRVLFFLRLAGKHEDIHDLYPRRYKKYIRWVRETLKSVNVFDPQPRPDFEAVKKYWIGGQLEYYSSTVNKYEKEVNKLKRVVEFLIIVGISLVVLLNVLNVMSISKLITFGILIGTYILTFFIGALENYFERFKIEQIGEEYKDMAEVFNKAMNRWDNRDPDKNSEIVVELAKEAMRENANWFLIRLYTSDEMSASFA